MALQTLSFARLLTAPEKNRAHVAKTPLKGARKPQKTASFGLFVPFLRHTWRGGGYPADRLARNAIVTSPGGLD